MARAFWTLLPLGGGGGTRRAESARAGPTARLFMLLVTLSTEEDEVDEGPCERRVMSSAASVGVM